MVFSSVFFTQPLNAKAEDARFKVNEMRVHLSVPN